MAELRGLREMVAAMRAQSARVEAATRQGVARGAHLVEARAKLILTTSSHPPGTPTPSAPGEPPSLVTGTLRRSITVQGPTGAGSRWEASIGPTVVYGRIQELGGRAGRGSNLPARPYMKPAVEASREPYQRLMRDTWKNALEG